MHAHIFSDREQTGGPKTSTSPQTPWTPQPCSAPSGSPPGPSRMPLLGWRGARGVLCTTFNCLSFSHSPFISIEGFPQNKQRINLGQVHHMWTFGINTAGCYWCSIFFQLNLTADWGMFCFRAFLYCHLIPCQLKLDWVGGRKSISLDATWGLHSQSELVLQSFLLSAEFSRRSVPSSHPIPAAFYQFS